MSRDASPASALGQGNFLVPGTCVAIRPRGARRAGRAADTVDRDAALRDLYRSAALAEIPRLLGAIDRNPFRATYGCLDRQYWHYLTSSFPSEMYQEGVLPLALVYATELPGNRWHACPRLRELATAAIRFSARASHADGSCDDYYPFERAFGAAVFSLQANARAYQLLELDDAELVAWLRRRANWVIEHDESGHLANHQALAALGLLRVGQIAGEARYRQAADARIDRLLTWQNDEGWFEEYGGADPGYQTVTIDCLAKIRRTTGDDRLDRSLERAVAFARLFLHPDNSFAGEYGSRGTFHFYPHGLELLAARNADAAELADGFLMGLREGAMASFSDDRMYVHRLGNLIEAYLDWSPTRPASRPAEPAEPVRYLRDAGLLVRRAREAHTVISVARAGVFKHFAPGKRGVTDAGLIVETSDGRVAASQWHDRGRKAALDHAPKRATTHHGRPSTLNPPPSALSVAGPLQWCRCETATPLKQALLYAGMCSVGRFCRTLVRRVLQRRLITGRRECPVRLTRSFELLDASDEEATPGLRVEDTIELLSPAIRVRRMAFGTDHQTAYVAASGVYQEGVLSPWVDLAPYVDELNAQRRVTIVREI